MDKVMHGFNVYAGGVDIFLESEKVRKTTRLAKEIIYRLNGTGRFDIPDNASGIDAILYCLRKADCEVKPLPDGREIYSISGDGFYMCGIVGDPTTIIIRK